MATLVVVHNMLFASCVSGRMRVLLWSMLCASVKKKTDEEKEKKEKEEEDNCSIREDSIAGMDYVVCVCRIWEDGCVGMEYVVSS